jgi:hypothetical protein
LWIEVDFNFTNSSGGWIPESFYARGWSGIVWSYAYILDGYSASLKYIGHLKTTGSGAQYIPFLQFRFHDNHPYDYVRLRFSVGSAGPTNRCVETWDVSFRPTTNAIRIVPVSVTGPGC